jgi:hypothetical protein
MNRLMLRATLIATATLLTATLSADVSLKPNSLKYNDSSVPAAKARSGSASIEARALLNQDGSTDVEVTTGSFDSSDGAPGTIAKVQLDTPSGGTRNFNDPDSGGTFTANVTGLSRRGTVGVQANVRDIDGARTDVVSATATVAKRPDLDVSNVTPGSAVRGLDTVIRADVHELNGDTGARANCLLLVNGSEVDRAEGIWVDANGSVQCAFITKFTTSGSANVSVVLDSVNPGDWDSGNNAASVTIEVTGPPEHFYSWNATATEEEFDTYDYVKEGDWREETRTSNGVSQSFQFKGVIRRNLTHSELAARTVVRSDGQLVADVQAAEFNTFRTPWSRCSVSNGAYEVVACTDFELGYATVDVSLGTAQATYRSWGWATRTSPFSPPEPRYEWNDTRTENTLQARFGSTVSMTVTFEDGGTVWEAQPFVAALSTRTRRIDRPYGCFYDSFTRATTCTESHSTRTTRSGSASGN